MPYLLYDTPRTTLRYIIDYCHSLSDIDAVYAAQAMRVDDLMKATFNRNIFKKTPRFSLLGHFFDALEDASQPLMAFWMIVSFFSLGAATVVLAGLFALSSLMLLLCGFFYYLYQDKKNQAQEISNTQLTILKLQAIDELFRRDQIHFQKGPSLVAQPNMNLTKIKSFLFGVGITNLLFCSFYWAMTDSLLTIGMIGAASIMAGPISFGVAAAIAIIIGAIVAYQHYQSQKVKDIIAEAKQTFADELAMKQTVLKNRHANRPHCHHEQESKSKGKLPLIAHACPTSLKRSMSQTFYGRTKPVKAKNQIRIIKKELSCRFI